MSKKLISIIIPVFREEKNISLITNELQEILETIKDKYDYEIIFVNDGSSDNTWFEIEKLCINNKNIK
jgi:polyisoprenyl-phosphate glycosyltransferase